MKTQITFSLAFLLLLAGGCCLIDEDLSECGQEYQVDYELRLVTNMRIEMDATMDIKTDIHIYQALENYLSGIFSDFAHDADMLFYDVAEPMPLLEHMSEIMDANQTSYTLHLPVRDYMHTAITNTMENSQVTLDGIDECHTCKLVQRIPAEGDCRPHDTGLFTARLPMNILADVSQHFDVDLYMANSATALIMETAGVTEVTDIRVVDSGFADTFNIADSSYVFNRPVQVEAEDIPVDGGTEKCFVSVHFPSRDYRPESKVVIQTEDPFVSLDAKESIWEWKVYATTSDGKITENILGIRKPLRAGQLKILRVKLSDTGIVTVDDPTVGVSVTLDWRPGMGQEVPL